MDTTFTAPGIHCLGCADTIKRALGAVPGVSGASVDVQEKTITVTHDRGTPREALAAALAQAGYPATESAMDRVAGGGTETHNSHPGQSSEAAKSGPASARVKDPVCGMEIDPGTAAGSVEHLGHAY